MATKKTPYLEKISLQITQWMGSTQSIVFHTIFFTLTLFFIFLGFDLEKILLTLTTIISVEAIYLALFIQMTVNRQVKSIKEVEKDIDEIQEDVDEIQEDVQEDAAEDEAFAKTVKQIHTKLHDISHRLDTLSSPRPQSKK